MNGSLYIAILSVFSFIVFLFSFWKYLKEDYIPSQIFSTAFIASFVVGLGVVVAHFFKEYYFWIIASTLYFGYLLGSKKTGIKFYEGLDALVYSLLLSFLPMGILFYFFRNPSLFLGYLMAVGTFIVFILVRRQYKAFIWYRSARRGFCGLFAIGLFFLTRALLTIYNPDYIFSLSEYDIIISGLISLSSFLNIFVLAKS